MPTTLIALHGLTFAGVVTILAILLRQHRTWVRVKDRINQLWFRHCDDTGDRFTPLDGNGEK